MRIGVNLSQFCQKQMSQSISDYVPTNTIKIRKLCSIKIVFVLILLMILWGRPVFGVEYVSLYKSQGYSLLESIPGLIHYWPINEGSGNVVHDVISGKNGDIYGAKWTGGVKETALYFDGIQDFVSLPDNNPIWLPQNNFTVSVWVCFERDSYYRSNELILDLNYANNGLSDLDVGYNILFHSLYDPRQIAFQMHTISSTDQDLSSDLFVNSEQWYHIVITRNDFEQSLYINGQLQARRTCSSDPIKFIGGLDDDRVNIGAYTDINNDEPRYCFRGKLCSLSMFERALSDEEIKQIFDYGLTNYELTPPVIKSKSSKPEAICDTVSWSDIGPIRNYKTISPKSIPDYGTLKSEKIINDYYIIEDVNVMVDINHNRDSDLDVFLVSPDNTRIELFSDVGGNSAYFKETILDDEADISITAGTAPFEGIYKPEQELSNLIGKNVFGPWSLEVTDDTAGNSGILNSWSLITNPADIAYYTECSLDSGFNNITDDSGWMLDRTAIFEDLDPNNKYWYRTKARWLDTWSQATKEGFETGDLNSTIATDDNTVIISPDVLQNLQLVNAIDDPSFEMVGDYWYVTTNTPMITLAMSPGEVWATEGDYSLAMVFLYDYGIYFGGDYLFVSQFVNWTGVDVLKFDFSCVAIEYVSASVYIGDEKLWEYVPITGMPEELLDQTIDVSGINGQKELKILVQFNYNEIATFDSLFFWDNFRTYKNVQSGSAVSGNIISEPIMIDANDTWDIASFNADVPEGTSVTLDILPEKDIIPIAGYANLPSDVDLSGLEQRTIRLRANLSTNDFNSVLPILHDWSVSYTSSTGESEWSNIVTSECPD